MPKERIKKPVTIGDYVTLGKEVGRLVMQKQKAYGDSFNKAGKVMSILYPDGVPLDALNDSLTVVRVIDKLFRIATDRDALGESPWRDIAGYALLELGKANSPEQLGEGFEGLFTLLRQEDEHAMIEEHDSQESGNFFQVGKCYKEKCSGALIKVIAKGTSTAYGFGFVCENAAHITGSLEFLPACAGTEIAWEEIHAAEFSRVAHCSHAQAVKENKDDY